MKRTVQFDLLATIPNKMKIPIVISLAMTCLILVAGCGKQSASNARSNLDANAVLRTQISNNIVRQQAEIQSNLDRLMSASQPKPKNEVEQLADKLFAEHLTQCGESWIGVCHRKGLEGTPVDIIVEGKGVSLSIKSQSLSDADRLNGIEWRGQIVANNKAQRLYLSADCNLNVNEGHKGWTEWKESYEMVQWFLEKKEGKWQQVSIGFSDFCIDKLEPISCDQKPQ